MVLHNATMWLRDTGILHKIRYDVIKRSNNYTMKIPRPKVQPKDHSLTIKEVGITIVILAIGLSFSIIAFLVELFHIWRSRRYLLENPVVPKAQYSAPDKRINSSDIRLKILKI